MFAAKKGECGHAKKAAAEFTARHWDIPIDMKTGNLESCTSCSGRAAETAEVIRNGSGSSKSKQM